MAAVTTFVGAQNADITVSLEDIKGFQKSDIGNHGNEWPWQKVVHKMEPLVFLGQRKYINFNRFFLPIRNLRNYIESVLKSW